MMDGVFSIYTTVSRFLLPIAAILFLLLCAACLLKKDKFSPAFAADEFPGEVSFSPAVLTATFMLTLMQAIWLISLLLYTDTPSFKPALVIGFLVAAEWICTAINRFQSDAAVELLVFFLTTIGMVTVSVVVPEALMKEFASLVIGLVIFAVLQIVLRRFPDMRIFRYVVAVLSVLLLLYNVWKGSNINGAKNWLRIGSLFSFQPSEIVKAVFIFVGAVTAVQDMQKSHIAAFIAYSAVCVGCLGLMHDFGAAAIYFVTMLVILGLRRSPIWLLSGISVAAVGGAAGVVWLLPYVASRFSTYRHVWENMYDSGYQQTRSMIAIANGGLFGLGTGNSRLQYVMAADTDLVFGVVCEQWGFIIGLCILASFVLLVIYALRHAHNTRYIAANAAAVLILFQTALNVFGSLDILPLTGVTLPFVSNGGSSLMTAWALLAFIVSARGETPGLTQEEEEEA